MIIIAKIIINIVIIKIYNLITKNANIIKISQKTLQNTITASTLDYITLVIVTAMYFLWDGMKRYTVPKSFGLANL